MGTIRVNGFEWDGEKAATNYEKHGLAFVLAPEVFERMTLEAVDDRKDYGETRFIALGVTSTGLVVVMVYTWRGDCRRIISLRKANKNEQEKYRKSAKGRGYRLF